MTLTNPLEVLKLKAQYSPISCSRYPHVSFSDLYGCACTKFNIKDSFKGLHLNLFQGFGTAVLYMQVYEYCRATFISHPIITKPDSLDSSLATIGSAFIARVLVTSLMVPVEAMRVNFTNTSTPLSFTNKNNKGFKVTMMRDLTYSCLFWLSVETIRNYLVGKEYRNGLTMTAKGNRDIKEIMYANVIPGFVSAGLISILTTPMDTVKTRIQSGVVLEEKYSLIKQLKNIYVKEGLTGVFSGVQYRAFKNSISSPVYITMYEYLLGKISRARAE